MSFYVGKYLISSDVIDPKHDRDAWAFPSDPKQHMSDTSNVEDLRILPTDMDVLPTQIQFGADEYTDDEGFSTDRTYREFYVKTQEPFYVRSVTAGSELYSQFYVKTQESFYVRSFTPSVSLYKEFYVRQEAFYVRGFTAGSELYTQFYVKTQENFYVRSFTPWSGFYVQAEEDC